MRRTPPTPNLPHQERASTGVPGLDDVLVGGLPTNHLYLVEGDPGSGKTTLGLHFLREGVRIGADATVGMGSVVLDDVPAGQTWVGVPARPIRTGVRT